MNIQPLQEAKALLKAFMDSKTTTEINIEKIYKLVDRAISEQQTFIKSIEKLINK